MSFLVDTNICSAHLKGDRKVTRRFLQYSGRIHISVITLGELYTWTFRAKSLPSRRVDLERMLVACQILPLDEQIAVRFGEVRAALFDQGTPVATADLFIATTALVHDLTLVTHNTSDFAKIPALRLDDWT
jgi:tRNA(fMet)-specific endonuclease VapC